MCLDGNVRTAFAATPNVSEGVVINFHLLPFQCSTRAGRSFEKSPHWSHPTAQMSVAEIALILFRDVKGKVSGLAAIFQAEPFQCSMTAPLWVAPTAQTLLSEIADQAQN